VSSSDGKGDPDVSGAAGTAISCLTPFLERFSKEFRAILVRFEAIYEGARRPQRATTVDRDPATSRTRQGGTGACPASAQAAEAEQGAVRVRNRTVLFFPKGLPASIASRRCRLRAIL